MSLSMTLAYTVDLSAPLVTLMPVTLMMEGDQKAHTLELTVTDGGEAATLTGITAAAYFLRADGTDVRNPGTIAGNVITIPLLGQCYSFPGAYGLRVVLTDTGNSVTRTILRLAGNMENGGSATVIDPTGTLPSYEQMAAMMALMDTALDDADAATGLATTKAGLADQAAALANTKAGLADEAAALANTKAGLADEAATLANTKAGLADEAATLANTKAGLANDAAESATEAAAYANGLRAPKIWSGTAITGTSTTPTAYATGIDSAAIGDYYLYVGTDSASVGNVYKCTTGGDAEAALWAYETNWRGAPGSGAVSTVNGTQPDASGNVAISGADIPVSGGDTTKLDAKLGAMGTTIGGKAAMRNLLDNWDFRNPVNQRGIARTSWPVRVVTGDVVTESGYGLDRWMLTSGSVTVNAGSITLNGTIAQISERAWGAGVVASVMLAGGTVITSDATTSISYDDTTKTTTITSAGAEILAAKLEYGSVSTLADDPPMDAGMELVKCQRYQYVINTAYAKCGLAVGRSATSANGYMFFPTTMRVSPTVVGSGITLSGDSLPCTLGAYNTSALLLEIVLTATSGVTAGSIYTIRIASTGGSLVLDANL